MNITTIINYYLHYNTFLQWFCNAWIIHNLPQFTKAFIVCRPSPRMIILKSLWCGSSYRSGFQFAIKSNPKFWTLHSLIIFPFPLFQGRKGFWFWSHEVSFLSYACVNGLLITISQNFPVEMWLDVLVGWFIFYTHFFVCSISSRLNWYLWTGDLNFFGNCIFGIVGMQY